MSKSLRIVVSIYEQKALKKKAIFLMGPTAAGKTDAAIYLHEKYACDIISVDSALVYRQMDIGTAKPDKATLKKAPHALVDIIDPWQAYSAANFVKDAYSLMQASLAENKTPLLAGGTMLYYRSLQQGLSKLPDANAEIRQELEQLADKIGWNAMHQRLSKIDSESAQRINKNDPQRISRALEVHAITGKTMTQLHQQDQGNKLDYDVLKIIIAPERALLHKRIEQRFEIMLKQGFIQEVEKLKANEKINLDMPSMRCVGYRQVWQYLQGDIDYEEMIFRGIVATRQLAKRQWTWLRKEENAIWLDSTKQGYLDKIKQLTSDFLEK
ncbi:MAG TPA: tRNA (adenosine(37)-N6)-dimethylallyltransferase MiaA [Oceanospirillales bacterium]|nr:tRNA (adenosine(37)-N6)-dimethylallyltransferase MiaA [Oceanospirillales bacterium]